MHSFFDSKRFQLLVGKHWADNKRRYGLSVLALAGLFIIWFLFQILVKDKESFSAEMQMGTFYFGLFVTGTLYASQYFQDLTSRPKGIHFLTVPASTFEKFLCGWLYTVVFFLAVFSTVFYLVDAVMIALYNNVYGLQGSEKASLANVFKAPIFLEEDKTTTYFVLFFLSVQSAFLLGSVVFHKFSFVKTVISFFVLFFVGFCITYLLHDVILPDGGEGPLAEWIPVILAFVVMYAVAPLLWTVAYFRLKQKQV